MRERYQDLLLESHLRTFLGAIDPGALDELRACLEWIDLPAGHTLMRQGEQGDAMYLVLSGRLRAYIDDENGTPQPAREMGRGQIVGEMSVITGEPRLATVVTVRDSVLVRLRKVDFDRLLATSPKLSVVLTRQVIEHLKSREDRYRTTRPITIALVPVSPGVDVQGFAHRLRAALERFGRADVVDAASIDAALGVPGIASAGGDADAARRVLLHLNQIEASHACVLLVADDAPTAWTSRCCRSADQILLLADAARPPALHPTEKAFLMERGQAEAAEMLVLLHPPETRCPRGTREWLARRDVEDHLHIRPARDGDVARLARILSHTAVGLVFAGGGARGLAHLGVYRALRENGVEIDYVGGTSIGAIMAALVACDVEFPEVLRVARAAFSENPTGDYNWLPLVSLVKGRRLRRVIDRALDELVGFDPDIEDLWKPFFCVASNYSQARETCIRRGNLSRAMRASVAIPGALPPVVHDGDLLCDGGTFNNFPVDVMHRMRGVGCVIGVDLAARRPRRVDADEVPGTIALLRDRWRPYPQRRYRFPSLLAYLMNVQILYSSSTQAAKRRLTQRYFNPPLERVGMLQWERFDDIVAQGYAHAVEVLAALPPGEGIEAPLPPIDAPQAAAA